jgi:hypothetical protein
MEPHAHHDRRPHVRLWRIEQVYPVAPSLRGMSPMKSPFTNTRQHLSNVLVRGTLLKPDVFCAMLNKVRRLSHHVS